MKMKNYLQFHLSIIPSLKLYPQTSIKSTFRLFLSENTLNFSRTRLDRFKIYKKPQCLILLIKPNEVRVLAESFKYCYVAFGYSLCINDNIICSKFVYQYLPNNQYSVAIEILFPQSFPAVFLVTLTKSTLYVDISFFNSCFTWWLSSLWLQKM